MVKESRSREKLMWSVNTTARHSKLLAKHDSTENQPCLISKAPPVGMGAQKRQNSVGRAGWELGA